MAKTKLSTNKYLAEAISPDIVFSEGAPSWQYHDFCDDNDWRYYGDLITWAKKQDWWDEFYCKIRDTHITLVIINILLTPSLGAKRIEAFLRGRKI